MSMNRRSFLKVGGAALAVPNIITSKALGAPDGTPPASERIVVAGIGVGLQGSGDLHQFMRDKRCQVVAVCDVQHHNLNKMKDRVNSHNRNKDCRAYLDYRELLEKEDTDFVMCGATDHQHAQITIDAMKAGNDIFCEKPLSLTIDEGRKMADTARAYGRVFSCGSQRVIGDYGRQACAARSGKYGKILRVDADPGGSPRQCYLPGQAIPPNTIEWDLWLGPAPWAPYHPYRCHHAYELRGRGFRTWYDYSGGMMTDWGGHVFGAALHGMGVDHTGPTDVLFPDGKDVRHMTMIFPNKMELHLTGGRSVTYHCEDGVAAVKGNFKVPPGLRWYEDGARSPYQDVINCVQTRKRPFRDVEYAHRVATVCHLANIANQLKRSLKWDPVKEDFIGDAEASRLVSRPRRGPWQI